jgi:hypothetical protein
VRSWRIFSKYASRSSVSTVRSKGFVSIELPSSSDIVRRRNNSRDGGILVLVNTVLGVRMKGSRTVVYKEDLLRGRRVTLRLASGWGS